MLILSLDCAGPACSAVLWQDGYILSEAEKKMDRGQDQHLMPLILSLMEKVQKSFAGLDRIAVTKGPGSFTGIRIGLAAARGLGLASGKPVLGIDRFKIYQMQIRTPERDLLIVLESKRDELFCCFYPSNAPPEKPHSMTKEEILTFLNDKKNLDVTGDRAAALLPHFKQAPQKEVIIAALIASKVDLVERSTSNDYLPTPLYLRPPDVTMKKDLNIQRSKSA